MKAILLCFLLLFSNAHARRPKKLKGWSYSLGVALLSMPIYTSDDTNGLMLVPALRIRYQEKFNFTVNGGATFNYSKHDALKYGPILKYRFARKSNRGANPFLIAGETNELNGLDDISRTWELGFFGSIKYRSWRLKGELVKGFVGGHHGIVAQGALSFTHWLGPLMLSPRIGIEFNDREYAQTYFGISALEAIRSGLNEYRINSVNINQHFGIYAMTPIFSPFTLSFIWRQQKLGRFARDSPLVRQRGSAKQTMLGAFITYSWQ